jgi:hypothetical protein
MNLAGQCDGAQMKYLRSQPSDRRAQGILASHELI